MWDELISRLYVIGHRLVVGAAEHVLFPPDEIGRGLPPVPEEAAKRRHPVILLHGIGDMPYGSQDMARSLCRDGWTVYVFETPNMGFSGVDAAMGPLHDLIERVKRETGAPKVDLVGHSQGGVISRYYARFAGDAGSIGRVVTLASPHHGLDGWYAGPVHALLGSRLLRGFISKGLEEMMVGSPMIAKLNAGDPTPDSIDWTTLYAPDFDGVVPAGSPALEGAHNIVLTQDHHGKSRGPHHFQINHHSLEAYVRLRDALVDVFGPGSSPGWVPDRNEATPLTR